MQSVVRNLFLLCLSGSVFVTDPGTAHAQDADATYQSVAEKVFRDAERALSKGDYIEAARLYNTLRSRFQYSQYAPIAELRLGDVYVGQEKFAAGIEQYRAFMKLHPNHPEVPYASWKIAESFYKQVPDDWFFLPPSHERELTRARDAERELRFFLNRHAESEHGPKAKKLLVQVRRKLADHEFYVAKFYLERKNPKAAAARLTGLLESYSGLGLDADALFLLGRSYLELKDVDRAKQALLDLIEHHGQHPLAADAREYLAKHNL